ncbi:MAG: uracil-DNA glycosylase [Alphaproteobacteria bacterium]
MQNKLAPADCALCPRLSVFRQDNQLKFPHFFNGAVPSFGALGARLLIVGLAPGLNGANQTGRPFTGDYAGLILYKGLLDAGFASGHYNPESYGQDFVYQHGSNQEDTLKLEDCRITNAVRCVPPENKPETSEIKQCNNFLKAEIQAMPNLRAILTLGLVSHNAVLRALGYKASHAKFGHGVVHVLGSYTMFNSYHCSRYNINTNRLSQDMFNEVLHTIRVYLAS